jgi:hypothetical protein
MRITTQSAIDISESLASYMLASYISHENDQDVSFEKRMGYVDTGKFSRADIYYSGKDMGIEVKSLAHGSGALKGVIQASMYKEQVDNGVFCIQKPRRKSLRDTLEGMCTSYGVGLVYIQGIPSICSKDTIEKATGGCTKPFELWKSGTYRNTRLNIISNSQTEWIEEYIVTLDRVIEEYSDDIFNFKIEPDPSTPGLNELHTEEQSSTQHPSVLEYN